GVADAGPVESAERNDTARALLPTLRAGDGATDGAHTIITQYPVGVAAQLFDTLADSDVDEYDTEVNQDSWFTSLLVFMLPMIILLGLFIFLLSRLQGGGRGGVMGFGKSTPKDRKSVG